MNMEYVRTVLGYCTLINFGILLFSSVFLIFLQDKISSLHARVFQIDQEAVRMMYFNYLAKSTLQKLRRLHCLRWVHLMRQPI